ncbi:MAG: VCBS repeat-containing protein [Flavobacteriaceae bacterium]
MQSTTKYCFIIGFVLLLGSCQKKEQTLFELLPPIKSGVTFQNNLTETDSLNILDYLYFYNGGGVAMGDINNDGLPDLYFSSNQEKNKLYLNKGNLTFEDISKTATIEGNSSWNTGSIMVDVNGDGWLDIYVLAVVGINGFEGHNELFINNKDNTFSEKSKAYGLDFKCYGTSAAFLDFDLDGDMDLYILNHAVHTEESFGRAQIRNIRNEKTGDKLLRNDGNSFTDISEEAGIFGGINGYGLGISVADFNQDGYPDIYVGNDFHEDDYFYLNNGNGTFTESLRNYFGHTSRFSMGNDVADINHDGWPDLITLDMLPEDDGVIKSSEGDDMYQTLKMRTEQYGYHYQYTRNMLFVSQPEAPYLETALQSGVAATDWSWSALFGDYNQDGKQDLFISNGIPKRPNNLDFIKYVSNEEIQNKINTSRLVDQKALELMPSGKVSNYFFKGEGSLQFKDVSKNWGSGLPSISGASAVGDLDNDGDLDIVTNNINEPASIYINSTHEKASYIKLQFQYKDKNPQGFGTKVIAYHKGILQYKELYTARGFQASSQPIIHFGFGAEKTIDSLKVIWPDQTQQTLKNVSLNQLLTITPENTIPYAYQRNKSKKRFKKVEDNLGINYTHKEDNHTDFNYQKLIPYEVSDRGPGVAIGDMNRDGKEDIFLGGAKNQKSVIYSQIVGGFQLRDTPNLAKDSIHEEVTACYLTLDGNSQFINLVGNGGNQISPNIKVLQNKLITETNDTIFVEPSLDSTYYNTSIIKAMHLEMDPINTINPIFIGNYTAPMDFGKIVPSYIFGNNPKLQELNNLGMVTDALWDDFNGDGQTDLIVIGEWMQPRFYELKNHTWIESFPLKEKLNGLWQTIIPFDIDRDGDNDYLLGNWGLNSKFKASSTFPMRMYYADFDENGSTETVLAIEKNGKYYPLLGLDELAGQMVFLRKKFTNYREFAGKTMEEIFGEKLQKATLFELQTLASGFLRNNQGKFTFEAFPNILQISPIKAFVAFDFNDDGKKEVLAGGNYFGVIPFHGRFDSFPGALISSENEITLGSNLGLDFTQKSIRHLKIIRLDHKPYLLVIYNNEKAEVYEITH